MKNAKECPSPLRNIDYLLQICNYYRRFPFDIHCSKIEKNILQKNTDVPACYSYVFCNETSGTFFTECTLYARSTKNLGG